MDSPGKLHGKVALVTGAAGAIGSEVCRSLAGLGASIVLVDIVSVEQVTSKIAAGGGKVIAVKADLTKSADVAAAFDKAVEAFGAVHIVVHLAGIILNKCPTIQTTSDEDWDRIFSVNVRGSFLVAREAANRLGPGGRIILTSSGLASNPTLGFCTYACTKAAVECLVKGVAKELAGRRITVNAIAPGPIDGPMLWTTASEDVRDLFVNLCPLGRLGEPSDLTPLVSFLASEEAEWVNGQIYHISGGLH